MVIKRGDIYFADLRPVVGSEQGGVRPVLIIQNDMGNRHSPTVICAAITSKMNKVCHLDDEILEKINHALCISLALENDTALCVHDR